MPSIDSISVFSFSELSDHCCISTFLKIKQEINRADPENWEIIKVNPNPSKLKFDKGRWMRNKDTGPQKSQKSKNVKVEQKRWPTKEPKIKICEFEKKNAGPQKSQKSKNLDVEIKRWPTKEAKIKKYGSEMKNVSQQKSQKSKNVNVKQKRWPTEETDILYPNLTKTGYRHIPVFEKRIQQKLCLITDAYGFYCFKTDSNGFILFQKDTNR